MQRKSTNRARPLHSDCNEAFTTISGTALAILNNAMDEQADYIELIEAANLGTLDSDEPLLVHVDVADDKFND